MKDWKPLTEEELFNSLRTLGEKDVVITYLSKQDFGADTIRKIEGKLKGLSGAYIHLNLSLLSYGYIPKETIVLIKASKR